jgi:hypothetical protein
MVVVELGSVMLPFLSLDGISAPGPGAARDLEGGYGKHVLFVAASEAVGSPAAVYLEVSLDGENWVSTGVEASVYNSVPVQLSGIASQFVRYVRANATVVPAGTTLSAWILSGHTTD